MGRMMPSVQGLRENGTEELLSVARSSCWTVKLTRNGAQDAISMWWGWGQEREAIAAGSE